MGFPGSSVGTLPKHRDFKPTDAEWAAVKPILDKLATPWGTQLKLKNGDLSPGETIVLSQGMWLQVRHGITSQHHFAWLRNVIPGSPCAGQMYGSVGWPNILLTFFTDPEWTAQMLMQMYGCIVLDYIP